MSYPSLVANRIFNLDFIENGSIVKLDEQSVSNRPLLRIMVIHTERLFLNALDLSSKDINARICSCSVRACGTSYMTDTGHPSEIDLL